MANGLPQTGPTDAESSLPSPSADATADGSGAGQPAPGRPLPPRHRPLVPVVAGFALGIALDAWLRPPSWPWVVSGLAIMLLVLWGVRRGLRPWGHWALAVALLVPFGGLWHAARFRDEPPWHLRNLGLTGQAFYYVRGRVSDVPQVRLRSAAFAPTTAAREDYWTVPVEADALSSDRKTWRRTSGGMTVFVGTGAPALNVGDEVEFLAQPRANRLPSNPAERNMALAAERHGSFATASVESGSAFAVLRRSHWYSSPSAAAGRLRAYVQTGLERRLRGGEGGATLGLVQALLLGERSALTPDQDELLKESGTVHFLAISGLHVGLFCLFAGYLLALLVAPVRARTVAVIALVWVYVAFTGLHVSAVRAGWTLTFLLAAPLLHRQRDSYSALAGAALMVLLVSPQQLFTPGFQLTFVAVWAIICVYPQVAGMAWPWEDMLARLREPGEATVLHALWAWSRSYLLLSVIVWAATAPLMVYHFNSLCLFAPLLNLVMWPLVFLLLLTCFILALCLPLGAWAVAAPAGLAGFFGGDIESLLRLAARLPGFGVYMPAPPLWWVALFYAALAAWALRRRLPAARTVLAAAVAVVGLAYVGNEVVARLDRSFAVTIADVGSGQAALLQAPEGQALLLDAGSSREGAQEAVADLLWHRRVGRLSAIIVSHFDADHCDFIPFLTERFRTDVVVVPASDPYTSFASQVRGWMEGNGLGVRAVREGAQIAGGGLRCAVLHPNLRFATAGGSENDRSLVVRCAYAGLTWLVPGDIQSDAISRLNGDYAARLKADVLLMPHHGHWSEGLDEFVRYVRPALAVVSGRETDCDPRTRAVLETQGVALWVTETEGAVVITLRAGRACVRGFKSGRSMTFEPSESRGPSEATSQKESE